MQTVTVWHLILFARAFARAKCTCARTFRRSAALSSWPLKIFLKIFSFWAFCSLPQIATWLTCSCKSSGSDMSNSDIPLVPPESSFNTRPFFCLNCFLMMVTLQYPLTLFCHRCLSCRVFSNFVQNWDRSAAISNAATAFFFPTHIILISKS